MSQKWRDFMREVENKARLLNPSANRATCGLILNLLEKALKAWCDARGLVFAETGLYQTHFDMLKSFRARLTTLETNREISTLRTDIEQWRTTFLNDSINAGVDYTQAYRNLRDLVNDTVPLSLRDPLPQPRPGGSTLRSAAASGPSSQPFTPSPGQPTASTYHHPAPSGGQTGMQSNSAYGSSSSQHYAFPTQQHGQFQGAGQTPTSRGRQASESSRPSGLGGLLRRNRTSSAVHLSRRANMHSQESIPPVPPLPRSGASRLSLAKKLLPGSLSGKQLPELDPRYLTTDSHPFPTTQHAARMPPPQAQSAGSLRLSGTHAGRGRPPPVPNSTPRESPMHFMTPDEVYAHNMQGQEYMRAAYGPPPPALPPPETEAQRRRRLKGKGRAQPPHPYEPGSGDPPYGGPPYGGPPSGGPPYGGPPGGGFGGGYGASAW
ncbi:hypothetical protein AURDEDRAFT_125594 [Auricularia subglabra TFB-10046 SS5]|nr:hypothetical protein AURDEDRAFT_125594 [Auricularia subglabra TFB-10046 SS5]